MAIGFKGMDQHSKDTPRSAKKLLSIIKKRFEKPMLVIQLRIVAYICRHNIEV